MIRAIKRAAIFAWEFLIPRFITEDVALLYVGDDISVDWSEWGSYEIVCAMAEVKPDERFDGVAEVESLTWLGIGMTYRVGKFRKWEQLSAAGKAKAPWLDYSGSPIFEGDTIVHPSGESGIVVFSPFGGSTPGDQWFVDYGTLPMSRLCLQIGDKGQAVAKGRA